VHDMPANEVSEQIPIFTVGYGSRTMDEFSALLRSNAIGYLMDIRSVPYSRYKPEFSREALEAALVAQGIRYLYMGEQLGGQPADRSCYVDDKVSYDLLSQKPFFTEGIGRIRTAYEKRLRIVLMCSEGRPETCHRSKLIGKKLTEMGVVVRHIDENGGLLTQDEVLLKLDDGQLSLFGEDQRSFTSRKRYRSKQIGTETGAERTAGKSYDEGEGGQGDEANSTNEDDDGNP
jgi:hypothetical protein